MHNPDLNSFLVQLKKCLVLNDYLDIMKNTRFSCVDFSSYIQFQKNGYTKNSIIRTDKFELILICWMNGQQSAIHDHGDSECIMVCLNGKLSENRYIFSNNQKTETINIDDLVKVSSKTIAQFDISHMNNKLGIHEIFNVNSDYSVSLHLYIPYMDTSVSYKPALHFFE